MADYDANSKPIYSTQDRCVAIAYFLERCGGDIDRLIAEMSTRSASRDTMRKCSVAFSPCLGITEADFMKRWRQIVASRR